ncbi:hypothetical protein AGR7A_pAt10044 [Agrobacterium deltaense NCPPB 1641]|uniref:Uncharacterized protein n=1 Tax=Agrobacterium deltaense NCPPB 1641 TaxID=1183425 RepID=A0A1S7U6Y2_9HYPH|nr:hypothetical protein AGR7A_pAt10044 [Agrobacterium deltaense NCPPB 1641]
MEVRANNDKRAHDHKTIQLLLKGIEPLGRSYFSKGLIYNLCYQLPHSQDRRSEAPKPRDLTFR